MSVNRYLPHVFVLPEDDANRKLANGFLMQIPTARQRRIQVLPVAGGWNQVLESFIADHVSAMDLYATRFVVLLIDFDSDQQRMENATNIIPERLRDRVFILGAWNEPQDLTRAGLGLFEAIGSALARDCREDTDKIWGHNLLRHNVGELVRLREQVRPILF
jgi:hypothetical protein